MYRKLKFLKIGASFLSLIIIAGNNSCSSEGEKVSQGNEQLNTNNQQGEQSENMEKDENKRMIFEEKKKEKDTLRKDQIQKLNEERDKIIENSKNELENIQNIAETQKTELNKQFNQSIDEINHKGNLELQTIDQELKNLQDIKQTLFIRLQEDKRDLENYYANAESEELKTCRRENLKRGLSANDELLYTYKNIENIYDNYYVKYAKNVKDMSLKEKMQLCFKPMDSKIKKELIDSICSSINSKNSSAEFVEIANHYILEVLTPIVREIDDTFIFIPKYKCENIQMLYRIFKNRGLSKEADKFLENCKDIINSNWIIEDLSIDKKIKIAKILHYTLVYETNILEVERYIYSIMLSSVKNSIIQHPEFLDTILKIAGINKHEINLSSIKRTNLDSIRHSKNSIELKEASKIMFDKNRLEATLNSIGLKLEDLNFVK